MRSLVLFLLLPSAALAADAALDCAFIDSNANCQKDAVAQLHACAPPRGEVGKLVTEKGATVCTFANGISLRREGARFSFLKDGKACASYEATKTSVKLTVSNGTVTYDVAAKTTLTCQNGQRYVGPKPWPLNESLCLPTLLSLTSEVKTTRDSLSLTLYGEKQPLFACRNVPTEVAESSAIDGGEEPSAFIESEATGKAPPMKTQQEGDKYRVTQNGKDVGYFKVEPDEGD